LRLKDDYDGASHRAIPLSRLLCEAGRHHRARGFPEPGRATLRLFAQRLQNSPQALPFMMQALDFWLEEPRRVVIAGIPGPENTRAAAGRSLGLSATRLCWQRGRGGGLCADVACKDDPRLMLHRPGMSAAHQDAVEAGAMLK